MDPAPDGQQFEPTSTCMPWSSSMDHNSKRYMRLPKNTPRVAKAMTNPSNTEPSHKNFPPCHHNTRQSCCTVCPRCLTRGRLPKSPSTWTQQPFVLAFGRCRAEARSLHEHKQSERHLCKDPVGPSKLAIKINQKNTRPTTRRPANPQPDLRFVKRKQQTRQKTGQGPNKKTTTTKICRRTQRIYHCATPQKPAKWIIHHDIPWNMKIEAKTSGFGRQSVMSQRARWLYT